MIKAKLSYTCPKCHMTSHNPNDVANFYCGRCHQFAEHLRDEQVTNFKHITDLYLTRRDCFTLALLTLADCKIPEGRIVHGWVTSTFTGELIQHAWCELPGRATYDDGSEGLITVAVDLTQLDEGARIVPAEWLYEQIRPHNMKRFTFEEACAQALIHGHDGPWDQ